MILVMPMAGRGSRFKDFNPTIPKPLNNLYNKPLFAWALESLKSIPRRKTIFITLTEHEANFNISSTIKHYGGNDSIILSLPNVTEGQLCTVLAAEKMIDGDEDVLIASSDTYIVSDLQNDIQNRSDKCVGIISVAEMPGEQWSFVRLNPAGEVVEVAEKKRISNLASTGLYYFSRGADLVAVGQKIIAENERTRGEFYIIPIYQKFIEKGLRVDISVAREMWDMGTPESLSHFQELLKLNYNKDLVK